MAGKTWHDRYLEARSTGAVVADKVAHFVGSWAFIYLHVVWFGVWTLLPVERYPYSLLTTILSIEAILLATLIIMAQNRNTERDRHQAEEDYKTDVGAKLEIDEIQSRLHRIETEKLDRILRILDPMR